MSSRSQESTSTSPVGLPTTPAVGGFISVAPPWQTPPTYTIYAEPMKDGRKLLLKLAKRDDNVARLLGPFVGSLVTTYVPQLGVSWTSTLAVRRRLGYLYVRVPARLKVLFEPLWLLNYPIPVIISIPLIPNPNPTQSNALGTGQPRASGSTTWPASALDLGGQGPGKNEGG